MSDLKELEGRLNAAVARIEAALHKPGASEAPGDDALRTENQALRASLASLSAQRDADVEKLDGLIDRLRPLIEELS